MEVAHPVYEVARVRGRRAVLLLRLALLVIVVPEHEAEQQARHDDVAQPKHAEPLPRLPFTVPVETVGNFNRRCGLLHVFHFDTAFLADT